MVWAIGCPKDPGHPPLQANERSENNSRARDSTQEPESPLFFMLL